MTMQINPDEVCCWGWQLAHASTQAIRLAGTHNLPPCDTAKTANSSFREQTESQRGHDCPNDYHARPTIDWNVATLIKTIWPLKFISISLNLTESSHIEESRIPDHVIKHRVWRRRLSWIITEPMLNESFVCMPWCAKIISRLQKLVLGHWSWKEIHN